MPLEGEYEPSTSKRVRDQVETYERTGGREGNTASGKEGNTETDWPVIILTTRGRRSGRLRKTPLMRVEHEGEYALIASQSGRNAHPVWYYNLKADPTAATIQDGPEPFDVTVVEAEGEHRAVWWRRAAAAYPGYVGYQLNTERLIPVMVATRRNS